MRYPLLAFALIACVVLASSPSSGREYSTDLFSKSCSELVRLAENCQTDLKTVDTVLGSAIDAGNMDRIKNYKLKKAVIKQQLEGALRAIEVKGCAKSR